MAALLGSYAQHCHATGRATPPWSAKSVAATGEHRVWVRHREIVECVRESGARGAATGPEVSGDAPRPTGGPAQTGQREPRQALGLATYVPRHGDGDTRTTCGGVADHKLNQYKQLLRIFTLRPVRPFHGSATTHTYDIHGGSDTERGARRARVLRAGTVINYNDIYGLYRRGRRVWKPCVAAHAVLHAIKYALIPMPCQYMFMHSCLSRSLLLSTAGSNVKWHIAGQSRSWCNGRRCAATGDLRPVFDLGQLVNIVLIVRNMHEEGLTLHGVGSTCMRMRIMATKRWTGTPRRHWEGEMAGGWQDGGTVLCATSAVSRKYFLCLGGRCCVGLVCCCQLTAQLGRQVCCISGKWRASDRVCKR